MRSPLGTLLLALGVVACGDDLPDQIIDPTQSGSCDTQGSSDGCSGSSTAATTTEGPDLGTTGTTGGPSTSSDSGPATVGIPDECSVSADCGRGELCVAPFVPEDGPEGKGPNECVTECVVLMDELRWCLDAVACCDPEAECTDRGYCELPGGSSSDGSSSDGGSSSGSGTGA